MFKIMTRRQFCLGLSSSFGLLSGLAARPNMLSAEELVLEGKFNLVDQYGRARTQDDLRGKPTILFFGYTHCPDFCPTVLQETALLMREMKQEADKLNFVFISIDPERDKPEILKDFLSSFDERIVGLTGTQKQVDDAVESFMAFAERANLGNSYVYDHSTVIYLFDAKGVFQGPLKLGQTLQTVLAQLRALNG